MAKKKSTNNTVVPDEQDREPLSWWHSFLTVSSISENVFSINTMLTEVHEIWVMHHAWWKAEMVKFYCLLHCFIHQLPFIKPFIFHTHPSFCFILLCHCPQWVNVSKFHLSAPSRGWQSGWGPGERHQTWDAGLGSPPIPSLFELLAPPSVCAWFGAGCRRRGRKALHQWQMTISE